MRERENPAVRCGVTRRARRSARSWLSLAIAAASAALWGCAPESRPAERPGAAPGSEAVLPSLALRSFPEVIAARPLPGAVPETLAHWPQAAPVGRAPVHPNARGLSPVRLRSAGAGGVPELAWRSAGSAPLLAAELPSCAPAPDPTRLAGMPAGGNAEEQHAAGSSWLPFARAMETPRPLPGDAPHPVANRPSADAPALASSPAAAASPRPSLPAEPLASGLSPDPARLPGPLTASRAGPDRPTAETDPTLDAAARAALARTPEFRSSPVPFLPLTIPDPFELLNALELRRPPPDSEPPVRILGARPGLQ